jgi:cell division protein FtsB
MSENVKKQQQNCVSGGDDSAEGWELEDDIATIKETFAKLTARVAALEAEMNLQKAQKGFLKEKKITF